MKSLISAVAATVAIAALAAPAVSFAQSNQPLTRAEVRSQLVQLEKAGYNPVGDHINYPENLQAAQARVDAQNGTAQAANSGYGSPAVGTSQSGSPLHGNDRNSVYFGN
nr:hypothetical protein HUO10_005061 [Paraburkholderia busanensis]